MLLFLMRMRRRVPFEGLRIMFGVSQGTAYNYYKECLEAFHELVVPRLLHPRSAAEIDAMTPQEVKDALPGAKIIFDLTAFPWKSKENVCWDVCSTRHTTTGRRAQPSLVSDSVS